MELLPTREERDWLIDALAALIAARGVRALVAMPIVLPTAEFFPDPYSFSAEGLDRVTRRLMQYAELSDLDVRLATFVDAGVPVGGPGGRKRGAAAVFWGIEDGCALFAFNEDASADAEYMAGVMAHEVAHAYRSHHRIATIEEGSHEEEELLTDVTSAFLGFGVLVANNSERSLVVPVEGGRRPESARRWRRAWSLERAGYLPPQAFSFLLALQIAALGFDRVVEKEVRRSLATNQASFLKASIQWISDNWHEIEPRLGLPDPATWPPLEPLESILAELPAVAEAPRLVSIPQTPQPDPYPRAGHVFRLKQNLAIAYGPVFGVSAAAIGFFATWLLGGSMLGALAGIPGYVLGDRVGRRTPTDVCSDHDCHARLPQDALTCPECKRPIVGTIERDSDRFDADEAYRRRQRQKRLEADSVRVTENDVDTSA